jgi:hypothetical protein
VSSEKANLAIRDKAFSQLNNLAGKEARALLSQP